MTKDWLGSMMKHDNGFDWYSDNRQHYLEIRKRLKLLRWHAEEELANAAAAEQLRKIEETMLAIKRLYTSEEHNFHANLKHLTQIENVLNSQFEKITNQPGRREMKSADQVAGLR